MADETLKRDQNRITVLAGVTDDSNQFVTMLRVDPTTKRLLCLSNTILANPMTTGGDIIYGGASGVPTRLANGTVGQVLTSNGTTLAPSWENPSGGSGVLIYRDVLRPSNASNTTDARWVSEVSNGGAADVSGAEPYFYVYLGSTATDGAAKIYAKMLADSYWENLRDGSNWTDFQYSMDTVINIEIRALGDEDSVFAWGFGNTTFLGEAGFSGTDYACFSIEYDTDGFYLKARTVSDTGTVQNTTITAITIDVITAKFLKIILTDTAVNFYVDGVLEATHTGDIPNSTSVFPAQTFMIGVSANGTNNEGDNIRCGAVNYEVYKV